MFGKLRNRQQSKDASQRGVFLLKTGGVRKNVNESGFSLLEVLITIALIATMYGIIVPQLQISTGASEDIKLGRLQADIRNAYDYAVLTKVTCRLVFHLSTGEYWLETTAERQSNDDGPDRLIASSERVLLGDAGRDSDPSPDEEKDSLEQFQDEFERYVDASGEIIEDPDTQTEILPESPVVNAKQKLTALRAPQWARVENNQWSVRYLQPEFVLKGLRAEHHSIYQALEELGEEGFAKVYFFPQGYVENVYIHLAASDGDGGIDETKSIYTIKSIPYTGGTELIIGEEEIEFETK